MITGAKAHPAAELFPMLPEQELRGLAEDIGRHGQLVPIVMHEGRILDGRNRWAACELAGVEPKTTEWRGEGSPVAYVWSLNGSRRHLTPSQKAAIAAEMLPMLEGEARERQRLGAAQTNAALGRQSTRTLPQKIAEASGEAREQAAALVGVNRQYVSDAKKVKEADPSLFEQVKTGELPLQKATYAVREKARRERATEAIAAAPEVAVRVEVADVTKRIPLDDGSVHLVVTSPPYGLDKPYKHSADPAADWLAFMADWLAEAYRVAAEGGRLALNVPLDTTIGGYRPTYAQAVQLARKVGWTYRATVVWDEGNTTKGNRGLGSVGSAAAPHPVAPVEMIPLFSKGEWQRPPDGVSDIEHAEWQDWGKGLWRFSGESRGWEGHPAPFPEELPRRLIRYLSFVGDVVLDPFCGSGTSLVVAHRLKRVPIGFDISPAYVASAKRRLAAAEERVA